MSVPSGATQAAFVATLVDEWVRAGITDAVVCPGSRSTPLLMALAARSELRIHVRLDERGAGFFALGLALAGGRPAIVCTTSGTAAVELHPAVVEAHHAKVPLIACTADRPPELHDVGAPQAIDQERLYGPAVRWSCGPGVAAAESAGTWRALAARAVAEAVSGPLGPGPVHLNLAFREPLLAEAGPLPAGRPEGRPHHAVPPGHLWSGGDGVGFPVSGEARRHWQTQQDPVRDGIHGDGDALRSDVGRWAGRRGIVVAGAGCGPPGAVVDLAERLGWPLLADPRSGCRLDHPHVIAAADALLRTPEVQHLLCPEVVLVLGARWTSRALAELLATSARSGAEVTAVDPFWSWADPDRIVTAFHRADPGAWLTEALDALPPVQSQGTTAGAPSMGMAGLGSPPPEEAGVGAPAGKGSTAWLARWQAVERAAQRAVDEVLAGDASSNGDRLTEPGLARRLLADVPPGASVLVSSSMPVRDIEWFAPPMSAPPRVLANRGANGIDGVSSTAQGMAAAGAGPVVAVLGDLAFLHDVSSLVHPAGPRSGAGCTLLVVDNAGGGIFSFLPQATALDPAAFDRLFGTPQAPDVAEVARGFGLEVADVGTPGELVGALRGASASGRLSVVRARVPGRAENAALHGRIHDAVAAAVRSVLG